MKKKKLLKYVKRRLHNIFYLAREGYKDFEIAAEMGLTEVELLKAIKKIPGAWRLYGIEKGKGYSRDMELLKKLMQDRGVNASLAKVYFAERHGITDRVEKEEKTDDAKVPELKVILSGKEAGS